MTNPAVASALLTADSVIIAAIGFAVQRLDIDNLAEVIPRGIIHALGISLGIAIAVSFFSTLAYLHAIVYPHHIITDTYATILFDLASLSLLFVLYISGGTMYLYYLKAKVLT